MPTIREKRKPVHDHEEGERKRAGKDEPAGPVR